MLRWLHAASAWLFVAAIVVQVFLAGQAIANLGGSGDFGGHVEFGYTGVGITALLVLVTALIARRPRRDVAYAGGLVVLYIVQTLLPAAKEGVPMIAALHPVNALLLFAGSIWYARRAWVAARATTSAAGITTESAEVRV